MQDQAEWTLSKLKRSIDKKKSLMQHKHSGKVSNSLYVIDCFVLLVIKLILALMNCYNWYANSNCPFVRSFFHKVNICVIFCPHEFPGDASSNCFLLKSLFHKVRKHLWNFLSSWTATISKIKFPFC